METNLTEVLKIIKSTVKLHETDSTLPYFFIVGAGISCPEIPTANRIVELCKEHLKEFDSDHFEIVNAKLDVFSKNSMKYYSEWIRSAFPNKIDRSNFYKKLISNAKISSANLLLAQILYSNRIANTVFTTNFDDSLTKALNLIGCPHFTSENNMDNLVINNQTKDIQIVHVHGTYNFYDCANLDSEIDCIASQTGTISSSQLLSIFLSNQAPIIVGYSGWENDVIMHSLKERLKYATPLQYIWICYDYESYKNLPDWIKESSNIDFVIPQEILEKQDDPQFFMESPQKPTIEATLFFNKLISELEIKSPLIFSNPYQYYSEMINNILPENEDVLHLRNWARRMNLSIANETDFEKFVKEMENALICNNFSEASQIINSMQDKNISKSDLEFIYSSLIKDFIKKESIITSSETKYQFYDSVITLIEHNLSKKIDTEILHDTLLDLCFLDHTTIEEENLESILSRIRNISSSSKALSEIELHSMGLLSILIKDTQNRKALLEEILEKTKKTTNNKIAIIRFNALINLLKISEFSDDVIKMIEEADKILEKFNFTHLKIQIYISKAFHLNNICDPKLVSVWLDEILSIIKHRNIDNTNYLYMRLIALTSCTLSNNSIPKDKRENLEEILISAIENIPINDTNRSELVNYIMCCNNLLSSNKNPIKYTYSKKIIDMILEQKALTNFLESSLSNALYTYFQLPNSLVNTEEKTNILLLLKSKVEYTKIYEDLLYFTTLENENQFKKNDILKLDIEYIENQKSQNHIGVELYISRNFVEAEKCFRLANQSNVVDISDTAKTNLLFMIRRNEVQEEYDFWGIVKSICVPNIFTIINILLFCIENNIKDSKEYRNAYEQLKEMESSIDDVLSWWNDISIVGEKEHDLVLSILDETFNTKSTIEYEEIKEPLTIG